MKKPSAFTHFDDILKKIEGKKLLFFLDYDGTLTPIVSHPKDAHLPLETKQTLKSLSKNFFVAIVTGRGLEDIQSLIGIDNGIAFAASHGFLLQMADAKPFIYPDALSYQNEIEKAYRYLCDELGHIPGIYIENKLLSVAVHDRQVEKGLEVIKKKIEEAQHLFSQLKLTHGKRVHELRPNLDWDKGKAVCWLIDAIPDVHTVLPIMIGDDLTDEDAFVALKDKGITISVQEAPKETHAEYTLKDSGEVVQFLNKFLQI